MKRNETEILKKAYVCVRFVNFREVFFYSARLLRNLFYSNTFRKIVYLYKGFIANNNLIDLHDRYLFLSLQKTYRFPFHFLFLGHSQETLRF